MADGDISRCQKNGRNFRGGSWRLPALHTSLKDATSLDPYYVVGPRPGDPLLVRTGIVKAHNLISVSRPPTVGGWSRDI